MPHQCRTNAALARTLANMAAGRFYERRLALLACSGSRVSCLLRARANEHDPVRRAMLATRVPFHPDWTASRLGMLAKERGQIHFHSLGDRLTRQQGVAQTPGQGFSFMPRHTARCGRLPGSGPAG